MFTPTPPSGIPVWLDIARRSEELKSKEFIANHAPPQIRDNLVKAANQPDIVGADGIYYQDTKTPFIVTDDASVTLSTSSLILHSNTWTLLPANYFTVGKVVQVWMLGRMTTGTTPGNITVELRFGTSASGTLLATSAAIAGGASKTNITWIANFFVRCRAIGSSGSLLGWGTFAAEPSSVVLPAANNPAFLPATAPAATTVDTTAASGIAVCMKRSGSTAETAQVHDLIFAALN